LPGYANGFSLELRSCHIEFNYLGSDKYEFVIGTGSDYSERIGMTIHPTLWVRLRKPEVLDNVGSLDHGLSESRKRKKTRYKTKALDSVDCFVSPDSDFGCVDVVSNSDHLQKIRIELYGKHEIERFATHLKGFLMSDFQDDQNKDQSRSSKRK
jgi:hypothetical protein